MKTYNTLLWSLCSLLSPLAHASLSYQASSYSSARASFGSAYVVVTDSNWTSSPGIADSALPSVTQALTGVTATSSSTVSDDGLSIGSALIWDEAAALGTNISGNSSGFARLQETGATLSTGGKIRFSLDYTLSADGDGQYAGFTFSGWTTRVSPTGSGDVRQNVFFSDSLYGTDTPVSTSGSWSSSWLSFSGSDDLGTSGYWWEHNPYSFELAGSSSSRSTGAARGTLGGGVTVNFRYEIVDSTAPVPEPEAWALLGAGCLLLGGLRRRVTAPA